MTDDEFKEVTVTAEGRALKAKYSIKLAQDFKAIHGIDVETELSNILSAEILAEILTEKRRELIALYVTKLKAGPCKVVFTKVNGEVREMKCTLEESVVPAYEKRTDRVKAPLYNTVSVWDLDKNQWRSFNVSNVISFEELPHSERYPR